MVWRWFLAEWWPREEKGRKLRGPTHNLGNFRGSAKFVVAYFAFVLGVSGHGCLVISIL